MNLKNALAVAAACVVVAACGGGSGDGTIASTGGGTVASPGDGTVVSTGGSDGVPQSALSSVSALMAYMNQLIGSSSDATEPLTLGEITLPVGEGTL